jgi:hypothetical protein
MSYYIGAKGEYIWEELLDNATSNVIIANNINLDAGPLSDALQDIITDAAGTALGDLIGETTQVPSALGQALITLSSLGLLAYNKLNRTAVQDVDSMVYSADYASILTPGMFDDRVRIRYDSNQFSNAFYYDGTTKKGEILTSRLNLLPVDSTNIDIYTLTGKVGIGITSPATQLHLYATNNILRLQTAPVDGTNSIEFVRGSTTDPLNDYRLHTDTTGKFKVQYSTNAIAYGGTGSDLIHISPTNINIYKDTEITGNVGIGTTPITSFHTYHATNNIMRLGTATNGKVSIEFVRGTDIDGYNDFRLINEAGTFRLQYEDDELGYGNTGTDLISASATQISLGKNTEISGNVGIGTASSSYNLDIFNQSTARIRLQSSSDFGATTSIEFRKGVVPDVSSDYRLINDNATFKLQYENADFPYGNNNNIMTWNRIDVVNYIQTRFSANVGINTDPHATYKLDVNGTVNTTAVRGNGAELTDLNAGNITTGTINLDRITLTANKLYESFNTTNFAVIDNKIDLPPNYSFSITDYDSQTLFNPSAERKYKGKMTANYDDRNGVYKLITTDNRTDNVAVLNYRVGDKISIRNTANTVNDYLLESGSKYFNSLLLLKRPTNRPLNWAVNDSYSILMYEWFSSDGLEGRPEARVRTPTNRYFPFTTVMTFIIEAGFNYYLAKLYNQTETAGGSVIVVQSPYGDDTNDFNRAFGAGQTFKLQITGSSAADDYIPKDYISADIGIASDRRLGGVKKGRGVAIDATTGELSSTPVSVDLINSMNTSHFTNNLTTGKIDISSTYVAPNATKLATARNIAGVSFDGTANIDIPYSGLTSVPTTWSVSQIPDLGAGKITSGTFSVDRIPDLGAGKITSGTFSTDRIPSLDTGKITTGTFADARIPNLDTGKITTGTFADARIPNLDTGKITTGTFADARIPNLDTGKITTGTFADARIPSLAISKTTGLQGALDGKAPTSHTHVISDVSGLQTALDGKAPTSHTHIISDVSGLQTALDGKAPTSHTHIISDITSLQSTLDGKQATINSTANQIIIGNGNGLTTTSTGLTFATNTLNATNLSITGTSTLTGSVGIGTSSTIPLYIYNATSSLLRLQTSSTGKPSMEFAVGTLTDTNTDYRIINDNFELKFQYQDNLVSYGATASHILSITDKRTNFLKSVYIDNSTLGIKTFPDPLYSIDVSGDIRVLNGRLGIGVNPATYPLTVSGDINLTGDYRKNGTIFKPDNAVLADNATKLATIRTIAGANFDGTANINIDYFNLNNRPIILQPTTTNLQLVSGYTLSVPGNVGVGTSSAVGNVLQVGSGARLRIANGASDYTIIGTNDTDGSTNTQIIISGNTRANNAGNIQYVATASGGSHIFYTTATSTRMTISSAGVNVNNDLGVSGNVGIGTAPATYKVNVAGDVNVSGAFRVGGVAITGGSKWTTATDTTRIYYNSGNVGIGTTNPTAKLHIINSSTTNDPSQGGLYVYNSTNSAGQNSFITNRIAGSSAGKVVYSFDVNAAYGFSIKMDANSSALKFNNDWAGSGSDRMTIYNNGAVGIQGAGNWAIAQGMTAGSLAIGNITQNYGGQSGAVANLAGLMMECSDNTEIAIHDANTSLHSFMRYTSNGNFRIGRNMGWGVANLYITGPLVCESYITSPSYILGIEVYARNGYDTRIRSDSGGMYLEMGGIGSAGDLLKFGAYNGITYMESGASRSIMFNTNGYIWQFLNNGLSRNAYNNTVWNVTSDHRIKENIKKANLNICYNNVKNINLYRFNYINGFNKGTQHDKTQLGFIAQQVQQHYPKSVFRSKTRIEDKREIPDLASVSTDQVNFTLFGAVKQLMRVVEKQSKRIKKLEEMLGIIDDDEVENDADEPYERIVCDEVDIDDIEPSEHVGV